MIKRTCLTCGKEFYIYPYQIRKGYGRFCSLRCFGLRQITLDRTCKICKKSFIAHHYTQKLCSQCKTSNPKKYQRQWRLKNPDKCKKYGKRYRETHKVELERRRNLKREDTRKYNREFYKKNRIEMRMKQNKRLRTSVLHSGKKTYRNVIKRSYPVDECCELCGEKELCGKKRIIKRNLSYHHWDDNDLKKGSKVKGIWICNACHRFITLMESGVDYPSLFQKYLKIKIKINEEFGKTSNR